MCNQCNTCALSAVCVYLWPVCTYGVQRVCTKSHVMVFGRLCVLYLILSNVCYLEYVQSRVLLLLHLLSSAHIPVYECCQGVCCADMAFTIA